MILDRKYNLFLMKFERIVFFIKDFLDIFFDIIVYKFIRYRYIKSKIKF